MGMLPEVNAYVSKLFSAIETHLVGPARNRERPADVAVPAAKDHRKDGADSMDHGSMRGNLLSICSLSAVSCSLKLFLLPEKGHVDEIERPRQG